MLAPANYAPPPTRQTNALFWGGMVALVGVAIGGAVLWRRRAAGTASGLVKRYGAGFNADCTNFIVVDRDQAMGLWRGLMAEQYAQGISPPGAAAAYWSFVTEAEHDGGSRAYPGCRSWWTFLNSPPPPTTPTERAQMALFMLFWSSAAQYQVDHGADPDTIWPRWHDEAARLGLDHGEIEALAETVHLG